jgi:hypothetical protein
MKHLFISVDHVLWRRRRARERARTFVGGASNRNTSYRERDAQPKQTAAANRQRITRQPYNLFPLGQPLEGERETESVKGDKVDNSAAVISGSDEIYLNAKLFESNFCDYLFLNYLSFVCVCCIQSILISKVWPF